jgi:hypothetical protein
MRKGKLVFNLFFAIVLSLALTACAADSNVPPGHGETLSVNPDVIANQEVAPVETASAVADTQQDDPKLENWVEEVPRMDEKGAVTVFITPINLNQSWDTIDFQVKMDTHTVDLGMDLAKLATLDTDTGLTVQAIQWDGSSGGHHVSGILSFPASVDSIPVLDGVTKLTLTLKGVDAPERIFIWDR